MNFIMGVKVSNVPNYAHDYTYWVANLIDTELWFYGAWDEEDRATEVAKETGHGLVLRNKV